jgi:hypothetical protein
LDNIDPAEFVAEENLNYKANDTSEDEGVNEDDKTIKTLNVPPLPASEEPPSEALRHGPLTFDPHPQEEEDEQTTLAASDHQAELMRWHYRLRHLPCFTAQAACHQRRNPQEACQGRATQVRRLSLWRNDKDPLARQRNQGFSQSLCRNQAGGMHFC